MIRVRFVLHALGVLALVAAGVYYAALDDFRLATVLELLALAVVFWSDR